MIRATLLVVAGIFLGLLAAFVLVVGVEAFSDVVHPYPKDFGGTHYDICRHVERYPAWVLAAVVPMWGAAALAGAWISQRIGKLPAAAVVGLLLLSGLVLNLTMLPYPAWFKAGCLVAIPVAIIAGIRWGRRPSTTNPDPIREMTTAPEPAAS